MAAAVDDAHTPRAESEAGESGQLARWAEHLMRHPWSYAIAVTAGLLVAATPMPCMTLGICMERRAMEGRPDRIGQDLLDREASGLASAAFIVLRRPAEAAEPDTGPC